MKTILNVTTGTPAEVKHSARRTQQKAFYQVLGFIQHNDQAPYSFTKGRKMSHIPVSTPRNGKEDRRPAFGHPGTEKSTNHSCTEEKWFRTSVLSKDCRMCVAAILPVWAREASKWLWFIQSSWQHPQAGSKNPLEFSIQALSGEHRNYLWGRWSNGLQLAWSPGPQWTTDNRTEDCSLVMRHHQLHRSQRSVCNGGGEHYNSSKSIFLTQKSKLFT